MDRRTLLRVGDINERATELITFLATVKSRDEFLQNTILIRAVERNVMVIGEAAKKAGQIDSSFKQLGLYKNITKLIDRNSIVHDYNDVPLNDLFDSVKEYAPQLLRQSSAMLKKELGLTTGKKEIKPKSGRRLLSLSKSKPSKSR